MSRQNNYDAAIEYARAGLRVVPCKPESKEPLIADWPRRGTTDRSQIREWFHAHPERNVAILTGGGVLAIDVDLKDDVDGVRSFKRFVQGRQLPHTAVAETGGGGFHYLFRVPTTVKIPTQTGFMPGLDIRGEAAKIIVAPSVHPETADVYQWITPPSQVIAEAPRWMIKALQTTTNEAIAPKVVLELDKAGDVAELAWDVIKRFPVERRGTRNSILLKVLCSLLGRGFDEDTTQEVGGLWWEHYHAVGMIGTNPREARREIPAMIKSILKTGTLRRSVGKDHQSAIAKISLTEEQWAAINDKTDSQPEDSFHTGVTSQVLCRTPQEGWFVEALIAHFTYEASRAGDGQGPLLMTNDQVLGLIEARHGERLNPNQLERLKRKYVSREGKPATHKELIVQRYTGSSYMKRASEFELTGLRELLDREFSSPAPATEPTDQPDYIPVQDSFHTGVTSLEELPMSSVFSACSAVL